MQAMYIFYLLNLLIIAYEDFKHRSVRLIWLITLLFFTFFNWVSASGDYYQVLFNILFVCIQLIVVTLYFNKVKKEKIVFDNIIGWGDIFILLIFTLAFNFQNFVIFLNLAFALALSAHLFFQRITSKYGKTVPLAAYLAMTHFVVIVLVLSKGFTVQYFYNSGF